MGPKLVLFLCSQAGGPDLLLGDHGQVTFQHSELSDPSESFCNAISVTKLTAAYRLLRAVTHTPQEGGNDIMSCGAGDDIAMGGVADDKIDGGDGQDVLLGDFGDYDFLPEKQTNWRNSIDYSTAEDDTWMGGALVHSMLAVGDDASYGGHDTIFGGNHDDFLIGGYGGDWLHGGAGQNDITGGSATVGAADSNDTITGGKDADVVLGDNGIISRKALCRGAKRPWPQQVTFERYATTTKYGGAGGEISRRVHPFDAMDLIGSGDTISVGAGDDRVWGQAGDDKARPAAYKRVLGYLSRYEIR